MNCLECGACCEVFLIFENLTEIEIEYYSIRFSEGEFQRIKDNTFAYIKKCVFFENKCLIYEGRPVFCRKFKKGSKYCKLCREWKQKQ